MLNPDIRHWDKGVAAVPRMTGAAALLDAHDLVEIAAALDLRLPLLNVLDVGCGTGRVAKHCDGYHGVDIAPSAILYCQRAGLNASRIDIPGDLPPGPFGIILCLSVFTHIDHGTRLAYLEMFAQRSAHLLVDIIPGDGGGSVALWTASEADFEADLVDAGYATFTVTDRPSPEDVPHRYYFAVRR